MLLVSGLASLFSCFKGFQGIEASGRSFCGELKHSSRSFHQLVFSLTLAFLPGVFGLVPSALKMAAFFFTDFIIWSTLDQQICKTFIKKKKRSLWKLFKLHLVQNVVLGVCFWLFSVKCLFQEQIWCWNIYAFFTHTHTHTDGERNCWMLQHSCSKYSSWDALITQDHYHIPCASHKIIGNITFMWAQRIDSILESAPHS